MLLLSFVIQKVVKCKGKIMIDAVKDVHVEYGKEQDGEELVENKFVVLLTGSKPIGEAGGAGEQGSRVIMEIFSTDGVEVAKLLGRYTVSVQIARTFDPEEVVEEVCAIIKRHGSAILQPKDAGKIVTP